MMDAANEYDALLFNNSSNNQILHESNSLKWLERGKDVIEVIEKNSCHSDVQRKVYPVSVVEVKTLKPEVVRQATSSGFSLYANYIAFLRIFFSKWLLYHRHHQTRSRELEKKAAAADRVTCLLKPFCLLRSLKMQREELLMVSYEFHRQRVCVAYLRSWKRMHSDHCKSMISLHFNMQIFRKKMTLKIWKEGKYQTVKRRRLMERAEMKQKRTAYVRWFQLTQQNLLAKKRMEKMTSNHCRIMLITLFSRWNDLRTLRRRFRNLEIKSRFMTSFEHWKLMYSLVCRRKKECSRMISANNRWFIKRIFKRWKNFKHMTKIEFSQIQQMMEINLKSLEKRCIRRWMVVYKNAKAYFPQAASAQTTDITSFKTLRQQIQNGGNIDNVQKMKHRVFLQRWKQLSSACLLTSGYCRKEERMNLTRISVYENLLVEKFNRLQTEHSLYIQRNCLSLLRRSYQTRQIHKVFCTLFGKKRLAGYYKKWKSTYEERQRLLCVANISDKLYCLLRRKQALLKWKKNTVLRKRKNKLDFLLLKYQIDRSIRRTFMEWKAYVRKKCRLKHRVKQLSEKRSKECMRNAVDKILLYATKRKKKRRLLLQIIKIKRLRVYKTCFAEWKAYCSVKRMKEKKTVLTEVSNWHLRGKICIARWKRAIEDIQSTETYRTKCEEFQRKLCVTKYLRLWQEKYKFRKTAILRGNRVRLLRCFKRLSKQVTHSQTKTQKHELALNCYRSALKRRTFFKLKQYYVHCGFCAILEEKIRKRNKGLHLQHAFKLWHYNHNCGKVRRCRWERKKHCYIQAIQKWKKYTLWRKDEAKNISRIRESMMISARKAMIRRIQRRILRIAQNNKKIEQNVKTIKYRFVRRWVSAKESKYRRRLNSVYARDYAQRKLVHSILIKWKQVATKRKTSFSSTLNHTKLFEIWKKKRAVTAWVSGPLVWRCSARIQEAIRHRHDKGTQVSYMRAWCSRSVQQSLWRKKRNAISEVSSTRKSSFYFKLWLQKIGTKQKVNQIQITSSKYLKPQYIHRWYAAYKKRYIQKLRYASNYQTIRVNAHRQISARAYTRWLKSWRWRRNRPSPKLIDDRNSALILKRTLRKWIFYRINQKHYAVALLHLQSRVLNRWFIEWNRVYKCAKLRRETYAHMIKRWFYSWQHIQCRSERLHNGLGFKLVENFVEWEELIEKHQIDLKEASRSTMKEIYPLTKSDSHAAQILKINCRTSSGDSQRIKIFGIWRKKLNRRKEIATQVAALKLSMQNMSIKKMLRQWNWKRKDRLLNRDKEKKADIHHHAMLRRAFFFAFIRSNGCSKNSTREYL